MWPNTVPYDLYRPGLLLHSSVAVAVISCCDDLGHICHIEELVFCFVIVPPPPPPCISYALVQATAGVGTVLIWYLI